MVRVARYADNLGSSPRVRGKPDLVEFDGGHGGLIPARAGKTVSRWSLSASTGAHPRACGENFRVTMCATMPAGSSPRVRGKLTDADQRQRVRRLIPARAGKTSL